MPLVVDSWKQDVHQRDVPRLIPFALRAWMAYMQKHPEVLAPTPRGAAPRGADRPLRRLRRHLLIKMNATDFLPGESYSLRHIFRRFTRSSLRLLESLALADSGKMQDH